ncbi:hypothetical protein [Hydrogenophaga sp. MI9]|uniref:hypothetical protein n=1 Tax=Hydrogenophaga sp. MI9 TaxID=3453719 RepID=UPI003EF01C38
MAMWRAVDLFLGYPMKSCAAKLCVVILAGFLASCGGGGDVAGDVSTFSLSPKEISIGCPPDLNPTYITIIGGQPPYRIINSWPDAMIVDKTEATGKDPVFKVTATGTSCVNPGTITVLDYHSKMVGLEVKMETKEAAATTGN